MGFTNAYLIGKNVPFKFVDDGKTFGDMFVMENVPGILTMKKGDLSY